MSHLDDRYHYRIPNNYIILIYFLRILKVELYILNAQWNTTRALSGIQGICPTLVSESYVTQQN